MKSTTYTPPKTITEPWYIQFHYLDTTQKPPSWVEDGTLRWTGDTWIVDKENPSGTLHGLLEKTWGVFGKDYTRNDRDFYEPFYYNPTSRQRVVVTEGAFPITEKPPKLDHDAPSHTTA